jgi:hypothetical protein
VTVPVRSVRVDLTARRCAGSPCRHTGMGPVPAPSGPWLAPGAGPTPLGRGCVADWHTIWHGRRKTGWDGRNSAGLSGVITRPVWRQVPAVGRRWRGLLFV